jgi:phospholipase/carboxylesterase
MKQEQFSNFKAYTFFVDKEAPYLFILHGYGATGEDLVFMREELDPEHKYNWVFPQAPLAIDEIEGYSWFPFSAEEFIDVIEGDKWGIKDVVDPRIIEKLSLDFEGFIEELEIPKDKIVLGGFSQGSIVSLEIALRAKFSSLALFLFSTAPLSTDNFGRLGELNRKPYFLQSHGLEDPLLPYSLAKLMNESLKKYSWKGEFISFHGGHEIPYVVLKRVKEFLLKLPLVTV